MNTIDHPTARVFYIGHDGTTVTTYGYCDPEGRVDCPCPHFETFTTLEAMNARLVELGHVAAGMDIAVDAPAALQRVIKKAQVNALRAVKLCSPVTYMGHPFDSDETAISNLNGITAIVAAGVPLPNQFGWRDADNVTVPMTAQQLIGLAGAMLAYRSACYVRSWELKDAIDAAELPSTVNISSGWPE